jgi:hypothetical protein
VTLFSNDVGKTFYANHQIDSPKEYKTNLSYDIQTYKLLNLNSHLTKEEKDRINNDEAHLFGELRYSVNNTAMAKIE